MAPPVFRPAGARAVLLLSLLSAGDAAATRHDSHVAAVDLVDAALLAGPGFQVEPVARIDGLMAHFRLHTRWGVLEVDSVELLEQRVAEMAAVETLYSEGYTDALKRSGIDALRAPVDSASALSQQPLARRRRAPAGILRYFGERLRGWQDNARRLSDRVDRGLGNAGRAGSGFALSPRAAGSADEEPWWDAPVDEFGRLLRSQAGHGPARRALAQALGIDPGSGNPLLRERLDRLAWAVAAERLSYRTALSLTAPGVAGAIADLQQVERITAAPSEEELRRRNETRMERWSADPDLRYGLAWRSRFAPELLSKLLDELARLAPENGAEAVLDVAWMAGNELEARFVLNSLRMLQPGRSEVAGGGRLMPLGALVGYLDRSGEFFLPLPVDRLHWLPGVRRWFDHIHERALPRRTVLLGGGACEHAARALGRRGWSVLEKVAYPGAPAYH